METLLQALGTVTLRPYFAAFFLTFFLVCSLHLGLKQTLLFAVAGYILAWASEYSSIHNGIPYGSYYYIPATKGRELWVLGVPFMDSMSFVFLSYASYSMALLALGPAGGAPAVEERKLRYSFKVRLLGALFCMYLDVLIDPLALRGSRWFLGQIYGYAEKGVYFGVPISNFAGWFIVAFCLIYALQLIDRLLGSKKTNDRAGVHILGRLGGPALYAAIILFNLFVALLIREDTLLWLGILIMLLPSTLLIAFAASSKRRLRIAEEEQHPETVVS